MMKIVRKYKSEIINPRVSKNNNGKKKKKMILSKCGICGSNQDWLKNKKQKEY